MAAKPKPRVILLANRSKPAVNEAMRELIPWLKERASVVAQRDTSERDPKRGGRREDRGGKTKADLAIVLGGDGTLLAQARTLIDSSIPILGVNFGKLGFLAEFTLDELRDYWPLIAAGKAPRSRRVTIDVSLWDALPGFSPDSPLLQRPGGKAAFNTVAINDAVITAGEPFRMIELELAIDPAPQRESAARFFGDGVLVSTASGSTAYNLAAGGPVVSPEADVLCVTPICPHSLAFRPLVVSADSILLMRVNQGNPGTTLVIDGQLPVKITPGQQVLIRRHEKPLCLLHHPRRDYWRMLGQKLQWAARPRSG